MPFKPIKRRRLGEQIATSIRDAILSGRYASGHALPSERDLATQFGVARASIREALHRLEAWGLVELRHGAAPKVQDFLASVGIQLLPHLIAPGGQLDRQLFGDLMRLRSGLLGWVASQAAAAVDHGSKSEAEETESSSDPGDGEPGYREHDREASQATQDALATLRGIVEKLEEAQSSKARQALDFEFFGALIALADNRVMHLIAGAVARLYHVHQKLFASLYADELFDAHYHRRTVEAIAQGERDEARDAMEAFGLSALNSEVLRCP